MKKMKSHTVPVQFQYSAHNARDRNSFQDHHTLHTSNNSKAGRFSTCTCTASAKYFMKWTSSTLCTCPQAVETGFQTRRLVSLEKSPAPAQWKDTLSHYSSCFEGIGHFPGEPYKFHLKPEHKPARHAPRKVPIHLGSCIQRRNQVFGEIRHSRRGQGTH